MKNIFTILIIIFSGNKVFSQTPTSSPLNICKTIPLRNNFEWIQSVKIGAIYNITGKSTNRVDEFEMSIGQNFEAGDIINVELTPGYKNRQYKEYWRIWIDLNNDNTFSENEIVFQKHGKGMIKGSFNIPEGGNGTSKVKVALNWKNYPSCNNHKNGEIEYYSANMIPSSLNSADFSFPTTIPIISLINNNQSTINTQGIIDNSGNKLSINIPYTNGNGMYSSFSSEYVINNSNTGKDGDQNSFRISYPAGQFNNTGVIPVDIEVDGDQSFETKAIGLGIQKALASLDFKINGQSKGQINLLIVGGIPDRNFKDSDHKFIYLPIITADGNTWLNNNLGANYSNVNHPNFNLQQQATSQKDFNAYGSLFQWGRYSDGHELINYTDSTIGVKFNGMTNVLSETNTPGHNKFIQGNNWQTITNPLLWQGEQGINNPCPINYRLPTLSELNQLFISEQITNNSTAVTSSLKLTAGGIIERTGTFHSIGNMASYYTSTFVMNETQYILTQNTHLYYGHYFTTAGMNVRCIKDQLKN